LGEAVIHVANAIATGAIGNGMCGVAFNQAYKK
jgi:hypothetical protein